MLNSLPPKKYGVKRLLPDTDRIVLAWFYPNQKTGVRARYTKGKRNYWLFAISGARMRNVTHWAEV